MNPVNNMVSDRKEMAKKLKDVLPKLKGREKESMLYKINKLEEPPTCCYTTTNVLTRDVFQYQLNIEKQLLDGYERIKNDIHDSSIGILAEVSKKKIYFYKKLLNSDFTGSCGELEKIYGKLTLKVQSLEIDPGNAVANIAVHANREYQCIIPTDAIPQTKELELCGSSFIELIMMDKEFHTMFGVIMLPVTFLVERCDDELRLAFDQYNSMVVVPSFKLTGMIRKNRMEDHFAMISGHIMERITVHQLLYCTICGRRCSFFGVVCACVKCNMKSHVGCFDYIKFGCRANNFNDTDSYAIGHQLEPASSHGLRFCCHCGTRIGLGVATVKCIKCRKRFHQECVPYLFETCGLTMELLKKMYELEILRDSKKNTDTAIKIQEFDLVRSIGRGATGRVVEAIHKKDGVKVAIKCIPKDRIRTFKLWQCIQREHKVMQRLNDFQCPFLARMRYYFEDNYYIYLAVDYYPGGDLFQNLMQTTFSEDQIKLYTAELILALEHLHANEIAYRDLKLENVVLHEDGHIVLCDFGTAKLGMKYDEVTYTYCGTVDTSPPEVVNGGGYTSSSDFWSLGVVVYELFHKAPPFEGKSTKELIEAVCTGPLAIKAQMSAEAADFIQRLLSKDSKERLGMGRNGIDAIKEHSWFSGIDWDAVAHRAITPEYIPEKNKKVEKEGNVRLTAVGEIPDQAAYINSIKNKK